MADHYKTLGISSTASPDEVKAAYKTLAKKWHPDKNQSNKKKAEEKFKEVSAAYKILCDEKLRREYDASLIQKPTKTRFASYDSDDRPHGRKREKRPTQKMSPRVQAEVIDLSDAFLIFQDAFKDDPAHGGPFFTSHKSDVDKVFDAFFNAPLPNPDRFLKLRSSGDSGRSLGI